jgi:DNA polymerase III gamma/tau subunit
MEKMNFVVAIISVLCDLMEGAQFEDEKDLLDFRQQLTDNGYNADYILEDLPLFEALHLFCSEFASMSIKDEKV